MGRASINSGQFTSANASRRIAAQQYFTDIVSMIGRNDSYGSLIASLTAMYALFPSLRKYQGTITPTATSSAVALDGSDQTGGTNNANRVIANNIIRDGLNGLLSGYIETADAVEFGRDVGKFKLGMCAESATGTDGL
jgi:hypothetical protein